MFHLDNNNILVSLQHGFRHRHSCESQLINTIESIPRSLDIQGQIDVLILDFEKAFDTVAHQRLLSQLTYYGLIGDVQRWISGRLLNRRQCVRVDGRTHRTNMWNQEYHRAQSWTR